MLEQQLPPLAVPPWTPDLPCPEAQRAHALILPRRFDAARPTRGFDLRADPLIGDGEALS